jgi:PAS domain S-box-containing protein
VPSAHVIESGESRDGTLARISAARILILRRAGLSIAMLSWIYAIAVVSALTLGLGSVAELDAIAWWAAVPLQCIVILGGGYTLLHREFVAPHMRPVWWLLWLFTAVSMAAGYAWNTEPPEPMRVLLDLPNLLYLADYSLLTAVFVVIFKLLGGSFRRPLTWLDIATMMSVQLLGVWSFGLSLAVSHDMQSIISVGAAAAYSFTLASILTMAALVCLQLPFYRGYYGVLLLIGAAGCVVGSEISWLMSWLSKSASVRSFYTYADVVCFTCIISAGAASLFRPPLQVEAPNPEKQAFGFLPILAVLFAIALMAGSSFTRGHGNAWIPLGLAAICVQLLITRQASMRKELRALNQRLAIQQADLRLTELVRRSKDVIMVIDAEALVIYASPAVEAILGIPPGAVLGTSVVHLFGPAQETTMRLFLDPVARERDRAATIELQVERAPAGTQYLQISASDHCANPMICGIVLTVHDVSAERALEREILDVATRERIRLCADIHDGLGQDLTGIALLLHAAAVDPKPNLSLRRQELEAIVGHVNRTIGAARDLARGYSPLHVVRGSLGSALQRLTEDANSPLKIRVQLDPTLDDRMIGDFAAEHLYRIAMEAVANAQRHSGGRYIDISMRAQDDGLVLSICDDGNGHMSRTLDPIGLGRRLMSYRARLIGGKMHESAVSSVGTRIEVVMPLNRSVH